jgi:hypothetical protein
MAAASKEKTPGAAQSAAIFEEKSDGVQRLQLAREEKLLLEWELHGDTILGNNDRSFRPRPLSSASRHRSMKPISHFASRLRTRRSVLGWSVVGILAAAAASFGWRRGQKPAVGRTAGARGGVPSPPQGPRHPGGTEKQVVAAKPMSRESFLPHQGSEFHIKSDEHITTVGKLVEVGPARTLHGNAGSFVSFALLFEVRPDFAAQSRMYVVSHEQLGSMELFLSPVGKSKRHVHLEAVFSQAV